jgi:methyl-accepting chemotaxis protein
MEEQMVGASETLRTTNDMVSAIQAIKDLTEHESVRAANVRKTMKDVVASSEAAVKLVAEGVSASEVMSTAIEQVVDSVGSNRRAVSSMNDAVKIFKV